MWIISNCQYQCSTSSPSSFSTIITLSPHVAIFYSLQHIKLMMSALMTVAICCREDWSGSERGELESIRLVILLKSYKSTQLSLSSDPRPFMGAVLKILHFQPQITSLDKCILGWTYHISLSVSV